jgi:hypothetical protein
MSWRRVVVALVALLTLVPIGGGTGSARQADGERATGAIFASVQRQAGLLPLDAPRRACSPSFKRQRTSPMST